MSTGKKPTIILGNTHFEVEEHKNIMFIGPEKKEPVEGITEIFDGADNLITAVFMGRDMVPTHVANWTKQTAQGIVIILEKMIKDMP